MNVLPDAHELEVQRAVARFFESECGPALVREAERGYSGFSRELWKKFSGLGWLTLCLPEDVGGQGQPITYLGLLLEEVGRCIAPLVCRSRRAAYDGCPQSFIPAVLVGCITL